MLQSADIARASPRTCSDAPSPRIPGEANGHRGELKQRQGKNHHTLSDKSNAYELTLFRALLDSTNYDYFHTRFHSNYESQYDFIVLTTIHNLFQHMFTFSFHNNFVLPITVF